jgi:hypothetical protein
MRSIFLAGLVLGLLACTPAPEENTPDSGAEANEQDAGQDPGQQDGGPNSDGGNGGGTLQCLVDGVPTEVTPGEAPTCRKNRDCGEGHICEKGTPFDEFGCCLQILCIGDADCADGKICDTRRGLCLPENACDPASGSLEPCGTGEHCTYSDGLMQCLAADALPEPTACTISPTATVSMNGAALDFQATATHADGNVPHGAFTFSTDAGTVADNRVTFVCAGPAPCQVNVTATSDRGFASCEATVWVFPDLGAGDFRVTVFDPESLMPLSGVPVSALTASGLDNQLTDENGSHTWAGMAGSVDAISAFPAGHQWQTILAPGSNDVALFTTPTFDDSKVVGVKGTLNFDLIHSTGDVRLGLVGTSIAPAIKNFTLGKIFGSQADYNITVEGVVENGQVALPYGAIWELEGSPVKPDYVAMGKPGTRTAWAVGGEVHLSEIASLIFGLVYPPSNSNPPHFLEMLLPNLPRFDHGGITNLNLTEEDLPASPGGSQPIPYSAWPFSEVHIELKTLLQQSATLTVPSLPCRPGADAGGSCTDNDYMPEALIFMTTSVPGEGLVPLGVLVAPDDYDLEDGFDQKDGLVDTGQMGVIPGQAIVDFAPQHDGLEGNPLATVILAMEETSDGRIATSALARFSETTAGAQDFSTAAFLPFQHGTYDGPAKTFTHAAMGNADFYRLALHSDATQEPVWNIYFEDAAAPIDLNTLTDQDMGNRTAFASIQAFDLNGHDNAPAGFSDLVGLTGANLDALFFNLSAWSDVPCVDPDAINPNPGCSVAP